MPESLRVTNYRGFERFTLEDLSRVNLLVGKNNSGKTALLEGIQLLVTRGDFEVLLETARRRGEHSLDPESERSSIGLSHFFYGHEVSPVAQFELEGDPHQPALTFRVEPIEGLRDSTPLLFEADWRGNPAYALQVLEGGSPRDPRSALLLTDSGTMVIDPRTRHFLRSSRPETPPVVLVTPESLTSESLGAMWNTVLRTKSEQYVRDALRILEPALEDVVFETWEQRPRLARSRAGILVGFRGRDRRVPLGSMGDGMTRLLALSISLIRAQNGYLLIDEIDTGLHYSVMMDMWRLVVEASHRLSIQVFATTHSFDCIRGMAALCSVDNSFSSDVSLHKIVPDLDSGVRFAGYELPYITEHEIEVR